MGMTLSSPAARLAVSPAAQRAAHTLIQMLIGTVNCLARAREMPPFTLYPAVRELASTGFATSTAIKMDKGQVNCCWVNQQALETMGLHHNSWHLPGELARLLERLPITHRFYQAAASIESLGRFERFDWYSGLALDASVTYEQEWVALLWSGRLETERALVRRLSRLGQDMVNYSISNEPAWPAMLYWVVDNQWQRELVLRVAAEWPGCKSAFVQAATGEGDRKRTERCLRALWVQAVAQVRKGQGRRPPCSDWPKARMAPAGTMLSMSSRLAAHKNRATR